MIYIATPYSHTDPKVIERRVTTVTQFAAMLCRCGVLVYSPITHGHQLALVNSLIETNASAWREHNLEILKHCHQLIVLGARENIITSIGCQTEIKFARENNISVTYKYI